METKKRFVAPNLYYLIWVDFITSFKKNRPKERNWEIALMIFVSSIFGYNLWIVLLWLKYFDIWVVPVLHLEVFPGHVLNSVFNFTIEFVSPFFIINYFLIFRKNRYKKMIGKYAKYKKKKGIYAFIYSSVILIIAFISAIVYMQLTA